MLGTFTSMQKSYFNSKKSLEQNTEAMRDIRTAVHSAVGAISEILVNQYGVVKAQVKMARIEALVLSGVNTVERKKYRS